MSSQRRAVTGASAVVTIVPLAVDTGGEEVVIRDGVAVLVPKCVGAAVRLRLRASTEWRGTLDLSRVVDNTVILAGRAEERVRREDHEEVGPHIPTGRIQGAPGLSLVRRDRVPAGRATFQVASGRRKGEAES